MFIRSKVLDRTKGRSQGDTIIEVLLSVTILGLVLALSFTSAGRSLNAGTDAANRNQALAYAQEQIELLRTAANDGKLATYPTDGTAFCINPSDETVLNVDSSNLCHIGDQSPFGLAVKYNSSNQTYAIKSDWQGVRSTNEVMLYYQVPNNPITAAPNVGITITASPSVVPYKGSTTISWTTSTAASCKASGAWSGDQPVSGSQNFSNLTTTGTYSLTCQSIDGQSSLTRSARVFVSQLPPPVVNFTASPSTVYYGNPSTLTWSTSNAVSCSASGGWSGSEPLSGSARTGNLTSSTTYSLSCVNSDGVSTTTSSVTVNVAAAPTITYFFASPNPVAYGGAGTSLYWNSSNASSCYSPQLGWIGTGGSVSSGAIYGPTTFTLNCYNGLWSAPSQTTVHVPLPTPLMVSAVMRWQGDNNEMHFESLVDDYNVPNTYAWWSNLECDGTGAFPTSSELVPTNNSYNAIDRTIHPWSPYYCGYHSQYHFKVCAQNAEGTVCSGWYTYNSP